MPLTKATPFITVVIITGTRRVFLKSAINSVLNQDISRECYEILVIKSFQDAELEDYLRNLEIRYVNQDFSTLGDLYAASLEHSKGEIVSFLEDDDLISIDKISLVYNVFKDNKLIFFQNDVKNFGDDRGFIGKLFYNRVPEGYINIGCDKGTKYSHGNMSSISIRKSHFLKYTDLIRKIHISPDTTFFILSLYLNKLAKNNLLLSSKKKLTSIRLHQSMSREGIHFTSEMTTNRLQSSGHLMVQDYKLLKEFIKDKDLCAFLDLHSLVREMLLKYSRDRLFISINNLKRIFILNKRYRVFKSTLIFAVLSLLLVEKIRSIYRRLHIEQ